MPIPLVRPFDLGLAAARSTRHQERVQYFLRRNTIANKDFHLKTRALTRCRSVSALYASGIAASSM